MKKIFVLVLLCLYKNIFTQTLTPLIPFMTSNQLIERSETMRKLQTDIGENLKYVKPGFRVELVYKEISKFKKIFKEQFNFSVLDSSATDLTIKNKFLETVLDTTSIKIPKSGNVSSFVDRVTSSTKLQNIVTNIIKKASENLTDPAVKKSILAFIIQNVFSGEIPVGHENNIDSLCNQFAQLICSKIKSKMTAYVMQLTNEEENVNSDNVKKLLSKFFEDVNDLQDNYISKAENEIYRTIEKLNKFFISSNLGLSVSKGSNDFSGGLMIGLNFKKAWQLGAFYNLSLDNAEKEINYPKSLWGLQFKHAWSNWEISGLMSVFYANENFCNVASYEYGTGISHNCRDIIGGLSVFYYTNAEGKKNINAGIFFKHAKLNLPTVYIGGDQVLIKDQDAPPIKWGVKFIYTIF